MEFEAVREDERFHYRRCWDGSGLDGKHGADWGDGKMQRSGNDCVGDWGSLFFVHETSEEENPKREEASTDGDSFCCSALNSTPGKPDIFSTCALVEVVEERKRVWSVPLFFGEILNSIFSQSVPIRCVCIFVLCIFLPFSFTTRNVNKF